MSTFTPIYNELGEEINFSSRDETPAKDVSKDDLSGVSEKTLLILGFAIAIVFVIVFIVWKVRAAFATRLRTTKVIDLGASLRQ